MDKDNNNPNGLDEPFSFEEIDESDIKALEEFDRLFLGEDLESVDKFVSVDIEILFEDLSLNDDKPPTQDRVTQTHSTEKSPQFDDPLDCWPSRRIHDFENILEPRRQRAKDLRTPHEENKIVPNCSVLRQNYMSLKRKMPWERGPCVGM